MEKQEDILKRVKLLMEYDTSMTYSENSILIEQRVSDLPNSKKNTDYSSPSLSSIVKPQSQVTKTVNYPKGFAEYKGWKTNGKKVEIKGTSVKEMVKNLRDFFFESPLGFATDVIISVAGVEVGGPLIMKSLEFAFLANDLDTYYETTTPEYRKKGFKEKFFDEQNKSFQDVIVDLMVVGTAGLIRGFSATKNYLKSAPKKISEIAAKSKGFIGTIKSVLSKIPKIGEWLGGKLNMISEFLTSLISNPKTTTNQVVKKVPDIVTQYVNKVIKTVPNNLPKAGIQALVGVLLYKLGEAGLKRLMNSKLISSLAQKLVNPDGTTAPKIEIVQQSVDTTIEQIKKDNPKLKGPFKYVDMKNGIVDVGNPPKKYTFETDYDYTLKPI
jgi:hypothetical protein